MTMTSEEETAFKQQPGLRHGCQVHTVASAAEVVEVVRKFAICQHALDPGLMLHTHIADQC